MLSFYSQSFLADSRCVGSIANQTLANASTLPIIPVTSTLSCCGQLYHAELRRITRPVAAKDYWSKGWLKPHMAESFNALLVDRKEIKVHKSPIDIMLQQMGDVYSLIMFPEGGRSSGDDEMGKFKSGLFYMAKKRPDLELVPVYIDNVNRILPRGEVLPVPLLSCITIGSPIFLETGEPKNDFLARARQAVQQLKES